MGQVHPSNINSSNMRSCREVPKTEQLPQVKQLAKWTRPQQGLLLLLKCSLATQHGSNSSLWLSCSLLFLHKLGLHLALCRSPTRGAAQQKAAAASEPQHVPAAQVKPAPGTVSQVAAPLQHWDAALEAQAWYNVFGTPSPPEGSEEEGPPGGPAGAVAAAESHQGQQPSLPLGSPRLLTCCLRKCVRLSPGVAEAWRLLHLIGLSSIQPVQHSYQPVLQPALHLC